MWNPDGFLFLVSSEPVLPLFFHYCAKGKHFQPATVEYFYFCQHRPGKLGSSCRPCLRADASQRWQQTKEKRTHASNIL